MEFYVRVCAFVCFIYKIIIKIGMFMRFFVFFTYYAISDGSDKPVRRHRLVRAFLAKIKVDVDTGTIISLILLESCVWSFELWFYACTVGTKVS